MGLDGKSVVGLVWDGVRVEWDWAWWNGMEYGMALESDPDGISVGSGGMGSGGLGLTLFH